MDLLEKLESYLRKVVQFFLLTQDAQPDDLLMLKIGQSEVGRRVLSNQNLKFDPLFTKSAHTNPDNFNFDQFFDSIYRQSQSNTLVEFSNYRPITIQLWLGKVKSE